MTRLSNLLRQLVVIGMLAQLTACGTVKYTVDDGRALNEEFVASIRGYGKVERAIRPAIARSAELKDLECDTQWELPIAVATSDGIDENQRVAWVRALNVDERLTVIAAALDAPLQPGDKIQDISGYRADAAIKMSEELLSYRDAGRPFPVTTSTGKVAQIKPFKVCRGYTRFAPPTTPNVQDYHWLVSVHPLQLAQTTLTPDEALWVVLWTQGISEEGGARMKTYHYGTKIGGTLYNLFTIASGLKGVAMAAEAAAAAAKDAGVAVASEFVKNQAKSTATDIMADKLRVTVEKLGKQAATDAAMALMNEAAANRGALKGVAWVASTVFDKADSWAYERMERLHANPLAAFALHQKLVEKALPGNAFLLDAERLNALGKVAEGKGRGADMVAILNGIRPEVFLPDFGAMPLASTTKAFSFTDPLEPSGRTQPFSYGLIDGMLNLPAESQASKK